MDAVSATLCFTGALLFLLALLNGFAIPRMRSPRIGLSAHLAGVQSGILLIALGAIWPKLALSPGWSLATATVLWVSLYVLWLSLLLGGIFGAGQGLPIAGGGITTTRGRQAVITLLLISGSLGSIVAVVPILIGLAPRL